MQVFNGFSVTLTGDSAKRAADVETLKALPGVRSPSSVLLNILVIPSDRTGVLWRAVVQSATEGQLKHESF